MLTIDCEQGSRDWFSSRLGKVSASSMHKIITPTGRESTQYSKYMDQLIAEVMTGRSAETFQGNKHTERGKELEAEAADYYAFLRGVDPVKVGFCLTDDETLGCSPDRLIGDDGLLEIKVPAPETAVEYMRQEVDGKGKLEQEYRPQTQSQLLVTGRKWVDTMCYLPGAPRQLIIRSTRNGDFLLTMNTLLKKFHQEMNGRLTSLREKGWVE